MDEVSAARDSAEVDGVIGNDSVEVDGDTNASSFSLRTVAPFIAKLLETSAQLPGAVADDDGASSDFWLSSLRRRCWSALARALRVATAST